MNVVFESRWALVTCVVDERNDFYLLYADKATGEQCRSRRTWKGCESAKLAFESGELLPSRDWEPITSLT